MVVAQLRVEEEGARVSFEVLKREDATETEMEIVKAIESIFMAVLKPLAKSFTEIKEPDEAHGG